MLMQRLGGGADGSQWTATTATGTLGPASSGAFGWNAGGVFVTFRDNASATAPLFYRSQIALPLVAATTYTLAAPINWGYGNGIEAQSTGLTIRLRLGGTLILSRSSRTAGANGLGVAPNTTTYTAQPFTPTSTGPAILQVEVELSPLTRQANDDLRLFAPSFSSCTVN